MASRRITRLMKRALQQSTRPFLGKLARFAGPLAGLALVIGTGGCASHRPAPLLIEHQARAAPACLSHKAVSLKLLTYNIWGLPSWMTGARPGRYLPIAREQLGPGTQLEAGDLQHLGLALLDDRGTARAFSTDRSRVGAAGS